MTSRDLPAPTINPARFRAVLGQRRRRLWPSDELGTDPSETDEPHGQPLEVPPRASTVNLMQSVMARPTASDKDIVGLLVDRVAFVAVSDER